MPEFNPKTGWNGKRLTALKLIGKLRSTLK